tara:strand:- start:3165 stop:4919 length:1755 start_codon:yes stop_codon:yes gene_type:complete
MTALTFPNSPTTGDIHTSGEMTYRYNGTEWDTIGQPRAMTTLGGVLPLSRGGTAAVNAADARTQLGLVIGTDIQAQHATLAAVVGGTYTGNTNITTLGTVTTGTISTGVVVADVTMTLGSDADGDVYYRSSNKLTRLAKGTANQTLTMNAGATAPEWASSSVHIGESPPGSPTAGGLWWDSTDNDGDLKIYYTDGDATNQWVSTNIMGGSVAGNDTELQYNYSGKAGSTADLTWDRSSHFLYAKNIRVDNNGTIGSPTTADLIKLTTNNVILKGNQTDDTDALLELQSEETGASTSPDIALYRNSASPAALDNSGKLCFMGNTVNGTKVLYSSIFGKINDPSNAAQDGCIYLASKTNGNDANFIFGYTGNDFRVPDGGTVGCHSNGNGLSIAASGIINLIQAGATVNSAKIKTVGKETIWMPGNAMRPAKTNPCASLTEVDSGGNSGPDLQVLDFDASTDEFAQFSVAMPKSWDGGNITYSVYWIGNASTDACIWNLAVKALGDGEDINVAFGGIVAVTDNSQSSATEILVSAESGAIACSGADGDILYFQISRDANNGSDTMSADARLVGVKIFFTTDKTNDA